MRQTKESPAKAEKRSMGCPQPSASPFTSTTRPPPFARRAAELRRYVDWLGAERAASILNVNPENLAPLLAGRAEPGPLGLRRLRRLRRAEPDR